MDVQTFPCFSMLSLTKPSKLVCHLRETSAEHTKKGAAGEAFSPLQQPGRSFQPTQALYCKLVFFHDYDLKLRS